MQPRSLKNALETAKAAHQEFGGRADFLVTANFKDFMMEKTAIASPNRYALHQGLEGTIYIVHPYLMMEWLRTGNMPDLMRRHHQ